MTRTIFLERIHHGVNIFNIKQQNADLIREVADLQEKLAEETRIKLELYFLYESLVERLRDGNVHFMQPPDLRIVRDSQVKK